MLERMKNAGVDFVDFVLEMWPLVLFVTILVLAFGIGLVYATEHDRRERLGFMAECEQYRPHYECMVLWRKSEWGL